MLLFSRQKNLPPPRRRTHPAGERLYDRSRVIKAAGERYINLFSACSARSLFYLATLISICLETNQTTNGRSTLDLFTAAPAAADSGNTLPNRTELSSRRRTPSLSRSQQMAPNKSIIIYNRTTNWMIPTKIPE